MRGLQVCSNVNSILALTDCDVYIYPFVFSYSVEEAMLLKANQKPSLDELVIQKGEFDWRTLVGDEKMLNKSFDETALTKTLGRS